LLPPHHHPVSQLILGFLLKDDETVILLLGVSFEGIWEREVEEKRVGEREILIH
jgi:hypothetical protein